LNVRSTQGYFGIDCSIDLRLTDGLASDPVVELDMPEGDGELLLLANATAADGVADASLGVRATAVALPRGVVQQRLRPLIYVYELPTWLSQAFEARPFFRSCAAPLLHFML
jgi:hypothetical protein